MARSGAIAKPARVQRVWAERSTELGAAPAWPLGVFAEESAGARVSTPAVPWLRGPGGPGETRDRQRALPPASVVLF